MSVLDRKAELERKKAKLAAMRQGRLKKEEHRNELFLNGISHPTITESGLPNDDAETILKDLDLFNNINKNGINKFDDIAKSASSPALLKMQAVGKSFKKLEISKLCECSFEPRESVSYAKDTQTVDNIQCETPSANMDTWLTNTPRGTLCSPKGMPSLEWDDFVSEALPFDEVDPLGLGDVSNLYTKLRSNKQTRFFQPDTPVRVPHRQITEEEKAEHLESTKFKDFFTRATRLVERALDEDTDIFFDYSGADREDVGKDQEMIKFERDFYDERWSANRAVSALDWSNIYPELLLSAYHINENSPHQPDGVCLIWNLKYKKTSPEYIFNYQAAITSAIMTEFNPSLVIGGTYAGQIILWDSRVNKRTPVQRTPLSGVAHSEPIKSLVVTGSQNAHNLISVSSDGKLCSWSLDMLGQPQQSLELAYRHSKTVSATSMAFFAEDENNFLIGALDGAVYAGSRHGNKAGITDVYEGHRAPVTSIAIPKFDRLTDTPPLFLTTSLDCSVKLWSKKENMPIFSFDDRSDYFLSCDWSPIHPSVFATVDLNGQLDVWNFNSDHEVPTASVVIEGNVSLNQCKFQKKGAAHIAVGDDNGYVKIFDINEKLSVPRPDDWTKLSRLISSLSVNISEQREFECQNHNSRYSGRVSNAR